MSDSDDGLDPAAADPFASSPDETEPEFNPWGLRNTEPDIRPAEVGQQFDLEVPWYNHNLVGLMKQTGGSGAEAWMHHVMGLLMLIMLLTGTQETDEEYQGEGNPGEELAEQAGGAEPGRTFDGPQ